MGRTAGASGKIEGIQALRAFAAVSVALCHMSFIRSGAFGVDIFFIISGFLMMHATENGLQGYWKRKFLRLAPFYWIMTLFTAAAVLTAPGLFRSYEVTGPYLLKSLLFIPYEHNGIRQPVLGLGYTLNYEMLFYLLFYVPQKRNRKYVLRGGGTGESCARQPSCALRRHSAWICRCPSASGAAPSRLSSCWG